MKSKLLLCLALVLSGGSLGFFVPQSACGYVAEFQINQTNLKRDFPFLKIEAVPIHLTNNEYFVFTVSVIPTQKQEPFHYEGILFIGGTNDFVAQTAVQAQQILNGSLLKDVPKRLKSKCVKFQFCIATKYLSNSQFRVEETFGTLDGAPADYIFDLKDFTTKAYLKE